MVMKHIYISGKVQGVSFRFHTYERAHKLNITGWVRNLEDGRVEVVAVAPDLASMNELIAFLETGPASAKVEDIVIEDVANKKPSFDEFSIRRDGGPTWQAE